MWPTIEIHSSDWKVPADGTYRIVVRDLHDQGGENYFYRLVVTESKPELTMSVANTLFQGIVDKELEIPVTLQRSSDLDDELSIRVDGLQAGITVTEVSRRQKVQRPKR